MADLILSKKGELISYLNKLPNDLIVRNVLRPTFAYVDFCFIVLIQFILQALLDIISYLRIYLVLNLVIKA
ncbi:hypothetical protein [Streptococcus equi]|uniref:hypothetical protein n=1 Tax=Streptococcus equi TaxID=1336 RepID=UPI003969F005